MATIDAARENVPTGSASLPASQRNGWLERRPVLRWAALLALGLLTLPCYLALLQVAGTFLAQPGTFFWPLLAATALYAVACWLVLRSFPASSPVRRWLELGLILALGLAA